MRLLVTADLHYNHPHSRSLADEMIDSMNHAGGDVVLVVGDTATTEGDALEQCLSRITAGQTKLFVAGNHELWTRGSDSYAIFTEELPRRIKALGWQWLETEPFVQAEVGIVGTVGWYDYSFAPATLGIPYRFYQNKVSPGAAERLEEFGWLLEKQDDIPPAMREVMARWNDGKFVHLHRSDEAFLQEILDRLDQQLSSMSHLKQIVAGIHHLPFTQMLPPPHNPQWDFAKAFLGSPKLGQRLLESPNVTHLFCGHSHMAGEVQVGNIHAINVGSGYRMKHFHTLDLE